jgi:HD-GYP domain-containing protein (c-di-GMP phosphodiesterase class II)
LLAERPYKQPWSLEAVANYIRRSSGTHFDPYLAKIMLADFAAMVETRNVAGNRDDDLAALEAIPGRPKLADSHVSALSPGPTPTPANDAEGWLAIRSAT